MDARKHLIIIKGKDQTDSVAGFQFHDGKCEVVYTSAPNKTYSFQSSNVEILPLQKKIHFLSFRLTTGPMMHCLLWQKTSS